MKTVSIPDNFVGTFVAGKSSRDYVLAKGDRIENGDQQFGITESDALSGNVFHIDGTMQNNDPTGIAMELSGEGTKVLIGKTGKVLDGQVSIVLLGEGQTLVNDGRIRSTELGISASVAGFHLTNNGEILSASGMILSDQGTVINNGLLDCDVAGISWTDGAGRLTLGEESNIRSEGEADGEGVAISRVNAEGVASLTVNAGKIVGSQFAFLGDAGDEKLVNTGKIVGAIDLGDGNDTFDMRSGSFLHTVDGGNGDDTYVMGTFQFNIVDSGDFGDSDTLNTTISRQLSGDWNIENLRLIGKADIDATGGGGDNSIFLVMQDETSSRVWRATTNLRAPAARTNSCSRPATTPTPSWISRMA